MLSFIKFLLSQIKSLISYPKIKVTSSSVEYDLYWNDKRKDEMSILSNFQKNRAKIVASYIKNMSSVLDIGCGNGAILQYLRKEKNIFGFGADFSNKVLINIEKMGFPNMKIDISDINALMELEKTDTILLLEVIEHTPNPEEIIQVLLKKCNNNLIFSIPNTGYWMHRVRLLFGRFPIQRRIHPGEHLRFWTKTDIIWWLNALSIKNYEIKMYEGIPILNILFPGLFAMGIIVVIPPQ
jgi:methionine biosynthesis protein MetW